MLNNPLNCFPKGIRKKWGMGNYMSEIKKKKDYVIKLHSQLSELLSVSRFSNFKATCNRKA